MESIAKEQKIKPAPEILFFALESYQDQKNEIERLKRIIQYKQNKIDKLTNNEL